MSDKSSTSGPNVGLLLLILAVAVAAKMAMHHHRMMWAGMGEPGPDAPYGRHGHHRFAGPDAAAARDGFRLPPRIEWMLETWHTRAHQGSVPADQAGPAEAPTGGSKDTASA